MSRPASRRHQCALRIVLFLILLAAAPVPAARSQLVLVVTSTDNTGDRTPGDGVCGFSVFLQTCTLRAAIQEANARPNGAGPDVILFAPALVAGGRAVIDVRHTDLPPITAPVVIDATTAGGEVVIDGYDPLLPDQRDTGLRLAPGSGGSAIRGLSVTSFAYGIVVESNLNTIAGNYIGLYADGTNLGNDFAGISITGDGNTIGTAASGNVIGFTNGPAIEIRGGDYTTIRGNHIGTNADGLDLSNGMVGNPWGRTQAGVYIDGDHTVVGGPAPADGNVFGFNLTVPHLDIRGSHTIVRNNYFGTDDDGRDLGGSRAIDLHGDFNTIGGDAGQGNTIAHSGYGILLYGSDNTVQGNRIGTNAAGDDMGLFYAGITVWDGAAARNTIGYPLSEAIPTDAPKGNVIAFSGGGVAMHPGSGTGTTIRGNTFLANDVLFDADDIAIDLGSDGVTANDADDADAGVNGLMNYPDVSRAFYRAGSDALVVEYTVSSDDAVVAYPLTVDVYLVDDADDRQPKQYIGTDVYTTPNALVRFEVDANSVAWSPEQYVVVTATDADGSTSEPSLPAGELGGPGSAAAGAAFDFLAAGPDRPASFELGAPYPNPFNPVTTFALALPDAGHARITVHDALGRQVAGVHDGPLSAGTHAFTFDAARLASGIYLLRVQAASNVATARMVVMK